MGIFEKKAEDLLDQLVYCDFRTSVGVDRAKVLLRRALKKQDRATRHACAEAVLQCGDAPALEIVDRCHAACINVRTA